MALPNIHDAYISKTTDERKIYRSEEIPSDKIFNEKMWIRILTTFKHANSDHK